MNILQALLDKNICFSVIKHYTKFMNVIGSDFFITISRDDFHSIFPDCDFSHANRIAVTDSILNLEKKGKTATDEEKAELKSLKHLLKLIEYINANFNLNSKHKTFYEYDMGETDLALFKDNLDLFTNVLQNTEGKVYELKSASFKELILS